MNIDNPHTFETYELMDNLKPLFSKIQKQYYRYIPFFILT